MATITELPKTSLTFEQKLDRLAQVAVNAGLGLQRGQELVMTASLDALPLARLITEQAYKAGASLVTTLFTDEAVDAVALPLCGRRRLRQGPGLALRRAWRRLFAAAQPGLRLPVETPRCCPRKIRKRSAGQTAPCRRLIVRRSSSLPGTTSIGPSWPAPRRRGRRRSFPLCRLIRP